MKIHVNQVPPTGLTATSEDEAATYELDTEDVKVPGKVSIATSAFLEEEELLVHLGLRCTRRLICARCLAPFEDEFSKEVDLTTPVAGKVVVDLTDDIRQQIVMEYPMKPLCREDCKGVCPQCGQNLNEGTCSCKEG